MSYITHTAALNMRTPWVLQVAEVAGGRPVSTLHVGNVAHLRKRGGGVCDGPTRGLFVSQCCDQFHPRRGRIVTPARCCLRR